MPFAIFKGEKTIHDLVARLFPKLGKGSKAAAEQAAAALLKTNPHLEDLSKVSTGSFFAIPDIGYAVAPAELVATPAPALVAAAERAQQLIRSLAERLDAVDIRAEQSILALAEIEKLSRDKGNLMDLSAILPSAGEFPKISMKNLEARQKARLEAFARLQERLAALGKKHD